MFFFDKRSRWSSYEDHLLRSVQIIYLKQLQFITKIFEIPILIFWFTGDFDFDR